MRTGDPKSSKLNLRLLCHLNDFFLDSGRQKPGGLRRCSCPAKRSKRLESGENPPSSTRSGPSSSAVDRWWRRSAEKRPRCTPKRLAQACTRREALSARVHLRVIRGKRLNPVGVAHQPLMEQAATLGKLAHAAQKTFQILETPASIDASNSSAITRRRRAASTCPS